MHFGNTPPKVLPTSGSDVSLRCNLQCPHPGTRARTRLRNTVQLLHSRRCPISPILPHHKRGQSRPSDLLPAQVRILHKHAALTCVSLQKCLLNARVFPLMTPMTGPALHLLISWEQGCYHSSPSQIPLSPLMSAVPSPGQGRKMVFGCHLHACPDGGGCETDAPCLSWAGYVPPLYPCCWVEAVEGSVNSSVVASSSSTILSSIKVAPRIASATTDGSDRERRG